MEPNDNELLVLEVIHRYVELLDKYFGSVSILYTKFSPSNSKSSPGFRKTCFIKKVQPSVLGVLLGFGSRWVFVVFLDENLDAVI